MRQRLALAYQRIQRRANDYANQALHKVAGDACGGGPALAKQQLPGLRGSEAHFSVIISEEDLKIFKRLGVRVSCEPKYETKKLYHR